MAVKWIEHKGVRILCADFSGLIMNTQLMPVLDEAYQQFRLEKGKVRTLLNFTDAVIDKEFMNYVKEQGKSNPAENTEKDAYVGITGVKNVLLRAYLYVTKDPARVFDTEDEALDWLAE